MVANTVAKVSGGESLTEAERGTSTSPTGLADPDELLTRYRVELTGYCYRMLGSGFDADDAVQETLVRAWRGFERFEGRSSVRVWLYRIATNVCRDIVRGRQRRALPVDLTAPSTADAPLGTALPEVAWLQPVPDERVLPAGGDPAELAVSRETIRLALVAALQHLPPKQRAVLILRDVLRFRSGEVAEMLETTVASVNGILRRARATLAATRPLPSRTADMDDRQRAVLARYVDAFERNDIDTLVALLHDDARLSMPPFALWLRGAVEIRRWFNRDASPCQGSRLVPVLANGSPAFAHYHVAPDGDFHQAFAIQVLTVVEGRIYSIDFFLAPNLFALFELPVRLDQSVKTYGPHPVRDWGDRDGDGPAHTDPSRTRHQ